MLAFTIAADHKRIWGIDLLPPDLADPQPSSELIARGLTLLALWLAKKLLVAAAPR